MKLISKLSIIAIILLLVSVFIDIQIYYNLHGLGGLISVLLLILVQVIILSYFIKFAAKYYKKYKWRSILPIFLYSLSIFAAFSGITEKIIDKYEWSSNLKHRLYIIAQIKEIESTNQNDIDFKNLVIKSKKHQEVLDNLFIYHKTDTLVSVGFYFNRGSLHNSQPCYMYTNIYDDMNYFNSLIDNNEINERINKNWFILDMLNLN